MDASPMAKGYYKLPDNAKWVDTLKCMVRKWHHEMSYKPQLTILLLIWIKFLYWLIRILIFNFFYLFIFIYFSRWQMRLITETWITLSQTWKETKRIHSLSHTKVSKRLYIPYISTLCACVDIIGECQKIQCMHFQNTKKNKNYISTLYWQNINPLFLCRWCGICISIAEDGRESLVREN